MLIASEFVQLFQPLLDMDSPVFPQAALRQLGVHMLWGVVLAAAGWRMAYMLQPHWRLAWEGSVWGIEEFLEMKYLCIGTL